VKAYESCINNTATKRAPWYIIPADDKENARIIISQVITATLKKLKMSYPVTSEERLKELLSIRDTLIGEVSEKKQEEVMKGDTNDN